MHEFSTGDGFVEITENLAEMIESIANEPSVGLHYIQQHTQNSVPTVVNLNGSVLEGSHKTVLHTEDMDDSITMVSSMKECGSLIADDMIADIKRCLSITSTKQPKRGLILNSSRWGSAASEGSGYFSSVFSSAKQRASGLKWPQFEFKEMILEQNMDEHTRYPTPPLSARSAGSGLSVPDAETNEPPLTGDMVDEVQEVMTLCNDKLFSLSENYAEFKAEKEAKLNAWLADTDGNLKDGEVSKI